MEITDKLVSSSCGELMTLRRWDGGGFTEVWQDKYNWEFDIKPVDGDDIEFSSLSVKDCYINTLGNFGTLTITPGYTGTVTKTAEEYTTFTDGIIEGRLLFHANTKIKFTGDLSLIGYNSDIGPASQTVIDVDGEIKLGNGIFGRDLDWILYAYGDIHCIGNPHVYLPNLKGSFIWEGYIIDLDSADELVHNGMITCSGTIDQKIGVMDEMHMIYNNKPDRTSELLLYGGGYTISGFQFGVNSRTVAISGSTTLGGKTPALGSIGPFTKTELIADDRLEERGGYMNFGNFEMPNDLTLHMWMILRNDLYLVRNLMNAEFLDTMNRFTKYAKILLDDPDGTIAIDYPVGTIITIYHHDGFQWVNRFRGGVFFRKESGNLFTTKSNLIIGDIYNTRGSSSEGVSSGSNIELTCFSSDHWLRANLLNMDFSIYPTNLRDAIKAIIIFCTSIKWDPDKISLVSNPVVELKMYGVTPAQAISQLLEYSNKEEFGVDDDFYLFTRQRTTSYTGDYITPGTYGPGDWTDYNLKRQSERAINRVFLFWGSTGNNLCIAENKTLAENLRDRMGLRNINADDGLAFLDHYVLRKDITLRIDAQTLANGMLEASSDYFYGTLDVFDSYDVYPGMVTQVTIPEKAGFTSPVDLKILKIHYIWGEDRTILHLVEPDSISFYENFLYTQGSLMSGEFDTLKADSYARARDIQSVDYNSFGTWTLGSNLQESLGNLEPIDNPENHTKTENTARSPWIPIGGLGNTCKDVVNRWLFANFLTENFTPGEGGQNHLYLESDVAEYPITNNWENLQAILNASPPPDYLNLLNTKQYRFKMIFTYWIGAPAPKPKLDRCKVTWE